MSYPAHRFTAGSLQPTEEHLAPEAVLQLTVNGIPYSTTVRTPGNDELLARGILFTEGVVTDPAAPFHFHHILDPEAGATGRLDITLPAMFIRKELEFRRSAMVSASCGMCGLREPEELAMAGPILRVEPHETLALSHIP